jgi:hypothetical protein
MCVCVCKYFHYVNMCVNILVCVLVVNIFSVLICLLKKKKKKSLHLRSNCTFDRRHGPAFELTCVCSSAVPYLTHTLLHACVRTYLVRSSADPPSHTHTQHECDRTHLCMIDRMRAEPSRDLF